MAVPSEKSRALLIRLPEGVTFALQLAGPVTRFLAWVVDLLATMVALQLIGYFVLPLLVLGEDFATAVRVFLFFAVPIVYGIAFEWLWRGQTPGKRALRLRVVDAGGLRLRFHQVFLRNILRAVDLLPGFYLLGGACCALNRRAQRLGDLAADTVVVRTARPAVPDLAQLMAGKYNSLRAHPALAARLRNRIPPTEASLALQALLRRETLDAQARVHLFATLAARFRSAGAPWPEEFADGALADEQLVRNCVDVLFRARAAAAGG
ncbi:MAG: RDD family protein [Verrucomicrobia bacterium]|nr:RDD family protein [Verrucomicrobiota bacterium]